MSSIYVTEAGTFIHKRNGRAVIGRNNEVLAEVPLEQVEDVTLIDTVQISSALITYFLEHKIPISWLSGSGKFFGSLINSNTIDVYKHKQQFDLLSENNFYLKMMQKIMIAKTHNQIVLLRRYNRRINSDRVLKLIFKMEHVQKCIFSAKSKQEVMGYEGIIARLYFLCLGLMVPEEFRFEKRTKRPPLDPFNSLISLGYSMLFNEILANVMAIGLHPYIGLGHTIAKDHPALVSDLIEEWRAVIIDSMVMSMIKRKMITADMFTITDEGCFLNHEARKIFLQEYNKKLRTNNNYLDGKYSFRECIKKQCKQYANAMMKIDASLYRTMEIR